MIKYLLAAAASLALASCEGLSVDLDNEHFQGSYSEKGGMVITPKTPKIILIDPAK